MKLERDIDQAIRSHFDNFGQVLILLGARQVGKTTLLKRLFPDGLYLLVDEQPVRDVLESYSISAYRRLMNGACRLIIDEAHLISDPGRAIKILYDQVDDIEIIVTGSSVLHIKNQTGESLAGRSIRYNLYPLTFSEYLYQQNIIDSMPHTILQRIVKQQAEPDVHLFDLEAILEQMLLYGNYPYTLNTPQDRIYLENLAETAVFRDIVELNLIENRSKAGELLKLLAYQTGNLVNYSELGSKLELHSQTVQRYIEIFEKCFLLYRLYPFSKNKREEIGKAPKIYFWDLGLRNAIIGNFDPLRMRADAGAMFENFILNEVKKSLSYGDSDYRMNYWRLRSGPEIDLVLSNAREIIGCEIKMRKGKPTKAFTNRYPEANVHTVTTHNFY